jgi:hypothetical protein
LQFFAWFEANGFALGNRNLRSRAGIAANASLSRFDDKNTEATEFNAFAAFHGFFHSLEKSLNGDLRFHFWNASFFRDIIDDVKLDHGSSHTGSAYSVCVGFILVDIRLKAARIIETAFMRVKLADSALLLSGDQHSMVIFINWP